MMQHVAVLHYLLWPHSSPLYEYLINFFIHLSVDGHLSCFYFSAIISKAAVNIHIHILCYFKLLSFELEVSVFVCLFYLVPSFIYRYKMNNHIRKCPLKIMNYTKMRLKFVWYMTSILKNYMIEPSRSLSSFFFQ